MSKLATSGKAAAVAIALTAGGGAQATEIINISLSDALANGQSVQSGFDISSFLTGPNGQRYVVSSGTLRVQGYSPYGTTASVITGYAGGGGHSCGFAGWRWCSYPSYPVYTSIDGVQDALVLSLGELSTTAVTQAIGSYSSYYGDLVASITLGAAELESLNSGGQLMFSSSATTNSIIGLTGATFSFELTNAPAVPEPATWGLMMLGFGAVGAAMRKSNRRAKRIALA